MRLQLPHNLPYPITIQELLKRPKERVARLDGLFTYSYEAKNIVQNEFEEDVEETIRMYGKYDSSIDGEIVKWRVQEGVVVEMPG
jgi:RNA polymerase II subunit A C-terminal domain phosphatase